MSKTQSEKSVESFDQLVNKIRNASNITLRDKGTLFEYMVKVYLEQAYPERFSNIWMLKDVPSWVGISHVDNGVDLVCQDETNPHKFVGVQAKFYKKSDEVSKKDVDSFIAGLGDPIYTSGIFITSNDNFNKFAKRDLNNQSKYIVIKGLSNLRDAPINWRKFDITHLDNNLKRDLRQKSKKLRTYQYIAVHKAIEYYRKAYQQNKKSYRRGQLIMAPGTGKTFTSLNIAESIQNDQNKKEFYVLYLVPSIQLLSQTLYSWYQDINNDTEIQSFAVTSDYKATRFHSRRHPESIPLDIGYPATTSSTQLIKNYNEIKNGNWVKSKRMYVVFSTYQSIKVIHNAQQKGFPNFDLTICDEAHRTAGNYKSKAEDGFFAKILHNNYVKSQLRLFQTATPKVYGTHAKKKGQEENVAIYSMDNTKIYGKVFYRLTFGQAVEKYHCLTDYKVEVLTVDESYIEKHMQRTISKNGAGIPISMVGKIIGTWNAMLKRKSFSKKTWGQPPMKRAIAFTQVIDSNNSRRKGKIGSIQLKNDFNTVMKNYLNIHNSNNYDNAYHILVKHADGSMNDMQKRDCLDWLRAPVSPNQAKILSNVKFLGEGIDVPSLDAIIFYAPKKSEVDIVQAIGRVMRLFHGKKYGYIILPIVIPYGENPRDVLDRNDTYKNIWQVLNALRSIDHRVQVEIDKLSFHNYQSPHIHMHFVGGEDGNDDALPKSKQESLHLVWKGLYRAITSEIVEHVGNRRYTENWSKQVAQIASKHIHWIKIKLQDKNSNFSKIFYQYWNDLKSIINKDISKDQAILMIAEHIITKPVFDALFGNNDFVNNNPVSKAMEGITHEMIKIGFSNQQDKLKPFYQSVKMEASGITNSNDKQRFIKELYNNFFSRSFKYETSKLGIVFTPVIIVNFIIRSVEYALNKYFNKSIASQGVNILDPFVGTGTFITQTLQYLKILRDNNKITDKDIIRNYEHELYCNEIVLLSYYIAAINIESVFHDIIDSNEYNEFKGIVLTDTFELEERNNIITDKLCPGNSKRLSHEIKQPIKVIMCNPPYSKDKNGDYPTLMNKIRKTYFHYSKFSSASRLYNSFVQALRWCSDEVEKNSNGGVIGLVTNANFLTSGSADGIRKCLYDEFNYIYIYNLKGNRKLTGDLARKDGAQIFKGSQNPIAISILVRKKNCKDHKIFYKDIGNYLTNRTDKFKRIKANGSIKNIKWSEKKPDKNNDWINQSNPHYYKYIPLTSKKGYLSIFPYHARGVETKRDYCVYGFSKHAVTRHVKHFINHYNSALNNVFNIMNINKISDLTPKKLKVHNNDKSYNWTGKLVNKLKRKQHLHFQKDKFIYSLYRPFTKKWLYYSGDLVEQPTTHYRKFTNNNRVIYVSGKGSRRGFSAIATNLIPSDTVCDSGQGFIEFSNIAGKDTLFNNGKVLINNINDKFANVLHLNKNDTFYYIYGILNSKDYKHRFATELQKDLPRIPIVKNVKPFVQIGRRLMWLHIHYEDVKPYIKPYVNTKLQIKFNSKSPTFKVKHIRYKDKDHKDIILFNDDITIVNVPLKAYDFKVNNHSAIGWIMDQYRCKPASHGIIDDPNKFSKDPKFILKLLLKIINVSVQSVDLINKLPKMQIINYDWRKH